MEPQLPVNETNFSQLPVMKPTNFQNKKPINTCRAVHNTQIWSQKVNLYNMNKYTLIFNSENSSHIESFFHAMSCNIDTCN